MPEPSGQKLPTVAVAKRYGVDPRSVKRWEIDPDLGFPRAMLINKRKYFDLAELEAWEKRRARGS
jgi:hypothetical protein